MLRASRHMYSCASVPTPSTQVPQLCLMRASSPSVVSRSSMALLARKSQKTSMGHPHSPFLWWMMMESHPILPHPPTRLLDHSRHLRTLTRVLCLHSSKSVPHLHLHQCQSESKSLQTHHHRSCSLDALGGKGDLQRALGSSMGKTGTLCNSSKTFSGCASGKGLLGMCRVTLSLPQPRTRDRFLDLALATHSTIVTHRHPQGGVLMR